MAISFPVLAVAEPGEGIQVCGGVRLLFQGLPEEFFRLVQAEIMAGIEIAQEICRVWVPGSLFKGEQGILDGGHTVLAGDLLRRITAILRV